MGWKALIADVAFKQGGKWLPPGSVLNQKLMTETEIKAHVAADRAHFEPRGRGPVPDKAPDGQSGGPEKPVKKEKKEKK